MKLIKETSQKITKALFYPDNKKSLIPNWLSFSRLITGISIPFLINKGTSLKTIAKITAFIATTDFLDGKTARLLNAESEEGALLDVISDKFFSILLISGLIKNNKVFILNGVLESIISIINTKALKNDENPKSNILGRIKIWPLSIAIATGYLSLALNNEHSKTIMDIATTLSILTIPLEITNIIQYSKNLKLTKNNHQIAVYEKENNKKEKTLKKGK